MTLHEWRSKKNQLRTAREVLGHPGVREMIECLKASNPVYFQARGLAHLIPIMTSNHSRLLGLIEGYMLAIECLESMATPAPKPPDLPQPTFEQPQP